MIVKLVIRLKLRQKNVLRLRIITDVLAAQSQRHRKAGCSHPCVRSVQTLAGAMRVNPKRFIFREKAIGTFARKREAQNEIIFPVARLLFLLRVPGKAVHRVTFADLILFTAVSIFIRIGAPLVIG